MRRWPSQNLICCFLHLRREIHCFHGKIKPYARASWGGMYINGQVKGTVDFYTAVLCAILMRPTWGGSGADLRGFGCASCCKTKTTEYQCKKE